MFKTLLFLLMLCCVQVMAEPRLRPTQWAVPVLDTTLSNVYWVDKDIYRAEQPSEESLKALAALGIKEILNLREYHTDEDAAEQNFTIHDVPMAAGSVTEEQLLAALGKIKNRKAPLLIHCWHGSDRTGTTVAAYRIVFQNWSKAQAIDEMVNGGYGYHGSIYPNLVELINKLDVEKMKQQLQVNF
jgi:protein tyrosine/serine phosphatase